MVDTSPTLLKMTTLCLTRPPLKYKDKKQQFLLLSRSVDDNQPKLQPLLCVIQKQPKSFNLDDGGRQTKQALRMNERFSEQQVLLKFGFVTSSFDS